MLKNFFALKTKKQLIIKTLQKSTITNHCGKLLASSFTDEALNKNAKFIAPSKIVTIINNNVGCFKLALYLSKF